MLDPFHKCQNLVCSRNRQVMCHRLASSEADSEMEFSEQNVFWEVPQTMTLMEGGKEAGIGQGRS